MCSPHRPVAHRTSSTTAIPATELASAYTGEPPARSTVMAGRYAAIATSSSTSTDRTEELSRWAQPVEVGQQSRHDAR
jgi:hypothetical protein